MTKRELLSMRTAISKISAPTHHEEHPDRQLECEEALLDHIEQGIRAALKAGWKKQEIDLALVSLSLANVTAAEAECDLDALVYRAAKNLYE